jgi:hypothetical protein
MASPLDPSAQSLTRLSRPDFNRHLRPYLQAFLVDHAAELAGHTVDEAQALDDLYDLVHGRSKLDWSMAERELAPLPDVGLSPACLASVVGVAVGCVALVLQAAGVPSAITRAVGTTVVNEAILASPALATTLEAEVTALMQADGLYSQAKAIFSLFGSIGNVVPISKILTAIMDELSWYQWVLVGVVITAQLTVWFSTGGAGAVAELVLFGAAIASLVISAENAHSVCSLPVAGLVASPTSMPCVAVDVGENPFVMVEAGNLYKIASDGTWTATGDVVEDFSAGMPSTACPRGQLWFISQAGDADGSISYVDYVGGGGVVQANAQASLISTGDDGETWAVQSDRVALRWQGPGQPWSSYDGPFDQIAVSSRDLQWALILSSSTGDSTAVLQRRSPTDSWVNVAGAPEATDILQIATNASGDLVCVTADNRVFQYLDEGSNWVQLGGDDISAQSICIRDPNNAWLIDTTGNLLPLGPLLNPSSNPGVLQWDTEDVWDETKSTHLYLVNRAAQLVASGVDSAIRLFVATSVQPMAGKAQAGAFRTGLCQGIYDADFVAAYNDPNWLGQPTWKSHFYDASSGENYMGETSPTALTNGTDLLQKSIYCMSEPDQLQNAGYFLGLALHYFTDLTQPMHAANYTYLSSFPFGYHTDFEAYTMSVQASVAQPVVTGFQPGSVTDVATLYRSTAANFKSGYFTAVEQAHDYATWKWHPAAWQAAVLPLIPQILDDAVSATAQLLYLYFRALNMAVPAEESLAASP